MPADGIGVVANAAISPSADCVAIKYDSCELYNDVYNCKILFTVLGGGEGGTLEFYCKQINPQNFEN